MTERTTTRQQATDKRTLITSPFLRTLAQDLITFCTLFAIIVWPLLNLAVFKPQEDLARRLDKIETAHEQTRQNLNNIDKNLAVLAESSRATHEALQAIRSYLSKEGR